MSTHNDAMRDLVGALKEAAAAEAGQDKRRTKIAEVVRTGDKLVVPDSLSYDDAIENLTRQKQYEDETTAISETFDCYPWDGGLALKAALEEMFGHSMVSGTTSNFLGMEIKEPPQMISVPIGPNEKVQVPWGRIELPQLGGYLKTGGIISSDGRFVFRLTGEIKRRYEDVVAMLGVKIRAHLKAHSIYRGKAVRVRFKDDLGDPNPFAEPKFLDLSQVREEELIFGAELDAAIRTNLFTPIERTEDCRRHGIPLKRGVLLAGKFGVGKTLAAYVTAKKAEENGWTFIYCEKADELPNALRFAQQYSPAVVFCEDIDRTAGGERTADTDDLLNTIDGIEAKGTEIMVILTTNAIEIIEPALLRPGRLDAVLTITPPDAGAVEKLIRLYGRGLVDHEENLTNSGKALEGQIPAVIREAMEKAKLTAIRLSSPGDRLQITDAAITEAAQTMQMHWELLTPKPVDNRPPIEKAATILAAALPGANHSN